MERDAGNSYLSPDILNENPMQSLLGHSITYHIAVGPHAGRKVFTLQMLLACDEPGTGKVAGFSPHAGVAAKANERDKMECLWPARSNRNEMPVFTDQQINQAGGNGQYLRANSANSCGATAQ